jgi:hypothetical protein
MPGFYSSKLTADGISNFVANLIKRSCVLDNSVVPTLIVLYTLERSYQIPYFPILLRAYILSTVSGNTNDIPS